MKTTISPFQLSIILANFIFSGSLMLTGQITTLISGQMSWQVPLILLPVILIILFIGMGRKSKLNTIMPSASKYKLSKVFSLVLSILLITVYIRDIRTLVHYISANLLPTTPIEVLMMVVSVTLVYIGASGLEVIARITLIHLTVLSIIVIMIPLTLINEISFTNLLPIFDLNSFLNISKSSFILFPWMAEAVIVFYLFSNVKQDESIRKATYLGTCFGFFLYFILLISNLLVLGDTIVKRSTFPNIIMIQQINITDFLDRLDLIIVLVWMPCLLSKLALILYCVQKSIANVRSRESANIILPLGLLLGVLSIILFDSTMVFFEFTFLTWTLLATALELTLLGIFLFFRIRKQKKKESNQEKADTTEAIEG